MMTRSSLLSIATLAILCAGCGSSKYKATNKIYKRQAKAFAEMVKRTPPATPGAADSLMLAKDWAGSINFGIRRPNMVVIHHTAQGSLDETIRTFTIARTEVSAHYVIADDGTVQHMVNDYLRAQHAGVSKWGNIVDVNSVSIGIELDNNGSEPFSDAQINSLLKLLATLKKTYTIPTANFIGHADVAPKRKPDPHEDFPWKKLAEHGFGLWYDDVLEPAPQGFDPVIALRIIGYDVSDLNSAIVAFKRHFIQTDITPVLTQHDLDVLNNLYRKYL